ncbi:MAG: 2-hydroxychromene-2-carboxylate isomerase [Alphaproteobacteria bacterium]|nr:MAG: 2-hydroxychromene-2-carboxylate isomerase [Alphaproteobacteria bacterium]
MTATTATIDYYYSIRSSFAYLGAARLNALARRHDRRIVHRPILLSVILPAVGAQPFDERPPHRTAYMRRDLERWAAHLGLPVLLEPVHHVGPMELPSGTVIAAQRAVQSEGGNGSDGDVDGLSAAILGALWRDDRDIADAAVLGELCEAHGFNAEAILTTARTPDVALELERNCREAIIRGVLGSPTYFVDGDNFYGQDRLDFVERALANRA